MMKYHLVTNKKSVVKHILRNEFPVASRTVTFIMVNVDFVEQSRVSKDN